MINRGKLRRLSEKGLMEARLSFYISDSPEYDRYGKKEDKWSPVHVRKNGEPFKEGFFNIDEWKFRSKSGSAFETDGVIHFGSHSNESILLRQRKK